MSNPKKPQRLSGERLEEIRACMPDCWGDEEIRDLLQEVDALIAELEERTRERDEAKQIVRALLVDHHAPSYHQAARRMAAKFLEKKGPADDR